MKIVLDASMALAWLIERVDPAERALARKAFARIGASGTEVPALWFAEVANTLLVFERARKLTEQDSANYLFGLAQVEIMQDDAPPVVLQPRILELGRRHGLTAYDATYLELAMRRGGSLATFDRKLADAARTAGVKGFGDTP